jgi:hypothetical protein
LVVDPDAILALAIPFQPFKPVPGRVQRQQAVGSVEAVEPQHSLLLEPLESLNPVALEKGPGPLVAET